MRGEQRAEVWRQRNQCSEKGRRRERAERGRPQREEAGERRGASGRRSPRRAREGRGEPKRLESGLLSDAGPGDPLSQKHKETPEIARPSPEPAPGAQRAIGRARLAALGEIFYHKDPTRAERKQPPRALAHPFPTPYRALLLSKVKGKRKIEDFFFFSRMLIHGGSHERGPGGSVNTAKCIKLPFVI